MPGVSLKRGQQLQCKYTFTISKCVQSLIWTRRFNTKPMASSRPLDPGVSQNHTSLSTIVSFICIARSSFPLTLPPTVPPSFPLWSHTGPIVPVWGDPGGGRPGQTVEGTGPGGMRLCV